jgi:hypothetical protein
VGRAGSAEKERISGYLLYWQTVVPTVHGEISKFHTGQVNALRILVSYQLLKI